jgi:hypothetical protein
MTAVEDGARPGAARELDDATRAVVVRLARPHASGGVVIERAAILAEGGDAAAISAHAGEAEATVLRASSRGLHGARLGGDPATTRGIPRRYLLPAGALA